MKPLPIHFSPTARPTEAGTYLVRLTPQGTPCVAEVTETLRQTPSFLVRIYHPAGSTTTGPLKDIHDGALWSVPLEWRNAPYEG